MIYKREIGGRQSVITLLLMCALVCILTPSAFLSAEEAPTPLLLGVHPYLSPHEIDRRFAPLAEYLTQRTGRKVKVTVSRDYESNMAAVSNATVDIAFLGPSAYVLLTEQYGSFPLLGRFELKGEKGLRGVIFGTTSCGYERIEDLRGKRFAFGDPASTMSHLVPRAMLLDAGIDVSDLSDYQFLGNHENVALSVLVGDFDAGAVKEEVFKQYAPEGLKAIAHTPVIAEHLFIASRALDSETVSALREALLSLRDTTVLQALKGDLSAFVPVEDSDYDSLRKIMKRLSKAGLKVSP